MKPNLTQKIVIALALFYASITHSQTGVLDSSFGNNGTVLTQLSTPDRVIALGEQSDGKIIALGEHHLARYNTDGSLDNSFGVNGVMHIMAYVATSMSLDATNNIYVGGYTDTLYSENYTVAKYFSNGLPDSTFGLNGIVETLVSSTGITRSIIIQPDGKIVMGVLRASYGLYPGAWGIVVRLNADGTIDTNFISPGSTLLPCFINDLFIDPNGKILVAGIGLPAMVGTTPGYYVFRLNGLDGILDSTYGIGGWATGSSVYGSNDGRAAFLRDGSVYWQSAFLDPNYWSFASYFGGADHNGLVDSNFARLYVDTNTNPLKNHYPQAITALSEKRVLSAGYSAGNFSLILLNDHAEKDSTCSPPFQIDFGGDDAAYAMFIDRRSRVVIAGQSDSAFALTRVLQGCLSLNDFVTTWKTDNPGRTNDSSVFINTGLNPVYYFDIDWDNDGVFDTLGVTGDIIHQYSTPGTYTIRIRGLFPSIKFGNPVIPAPNDGPKLISVDQWGSQYWGHLRHAFDGCYNMNILATDTPHLGSLTLNSLNRTFAGCASLNAPLDHWDVSSITDMSYMFDSALVFNQDLSSWDVSNVTNMSDMFSNATSFDQNLGSWSFGPYVNLSHAFDSTGISLENYDSTLIGWANQNQPDSIPVGVLGLKYCAGKHARDSLIAKGWTFVGDSLDAACFCVPTYDSILTSSCKNYISPSGNYTWSQSGVYQDTLTNADGCDSVLTINLAIQTVDTAVTQSGVMLTANANGATYQWIDCSTMQPISGETNQSFIATANGNYAVVVTENGCTDTSACYTINSVGLEQWGESRINVYPNPSSGEFTIEFPDASFIGDLVIYSVSGQAAYRQKLTGELKLELSPGLGKGVYLLKILSGDQQYNYHLIID